jgi:type IV pilus assembly protein PilV
MQPKQTNLDLMTPTAESRMVSTVPEAGFTLIEILVAVLVLTMGLLGIASLQLTSLRANRSAYLRTQATILAQDMLERVRGNRVLARSRGYDIALGDAIPPYRTCTGLGNECNPGDLRDYDQGEWLSALANLLPAGDGAVRTFVDNTVSPAAVTVTITIRWDDPVDPSGATGFTFASRI